jgi:hypothetical protein
MDTGISFANVNWLMVMVAATLGFVLGGCWYSPALFGRFLPGLMSDAKSGGDSPTGPTRYLASIFTLSFALLWLAAAFLAGLIGPQATAREGIYIGLAVGLFFVIPAHAIAAMFGARPIQIIFINGAYFAVCLAAMGAILAVWS